MDSSSKSAETTLGNKARSELSKRTFVVDRRLASLALISWLRWLASLGRLDRLWLWHDYLWLLLGWLLLGRHASLVKLGWLSQFRRP
jgi:hypothetical protein